MLRFVIYALTVLHLAPGFAFTVLAFGCDPVTPALGAYCDQGTWQPFAQLTLAATLVLVVIFALTHRRAPA